MADLADLGEIANDFRFQCRCMQAAMGMALSVMIEEDNVPSHTQRVSYAESILNNSASGLEIARAVLENATIAAEANIADIATDSNVPDADIQFAVNTVFNALAGIAN